MFTIAWVLFRRSLTTSPEVSQLAEQVARLFKREGGAGTVGGGPMKDDDTTGKGQARRAAG